MCRVIIIIKTNFFLISFVTGCIKKKNYMSVTFCNSNNIHPISGCDSAPSNYTKLIPKFSTLLTSAGFYSNDTISCPVPTTNKKCYANTITQTNSDGTTTDRPFITGLQGTDVFGINYNSTQFPYCYKPNNKGDQQFLGASTSTPVAADNLEFLILPVTNGNNPCNNEFAVKNGQSVSSYNPNTCNKMPLGDCTEMCEFGGFSCAPGLDPQNVGSCINVSTNEYTNYYGTTPAPTTEYAIQAFRCINSNKKYGCDFTKGTCSLQEGAGQFDTMEACQQYCTICDPTNYFLIGGDTNTPRCYRNPPNCYLDATDKTIKCANNWECIDGCNQKDVRDMFFADMLDTPYLTYQCLSTGLTQCTTQPSCDKHGHGYIYSPENNCIP